MPGRLGRWPVLLGTRWRGRSSAHCAREPWRGCQAAESGLGPASSRRAAGRDTSLLGPVQLALSSPGLGVSEPGASLKTEDPVTDKM